MSSSSVLPFSHFIKHNSFSIHGTDISVLIYIPENFYDFSLYKIFNFYGLHERFNYLSFTVLIIQTDCTLYGNKTQ